MDVVTPMAESLFNDDMKEIMISLIFESKIMILGNDFANEYIESKNASVPKIVHW